MVTAGQLFSPAVRAFIDEHLGHSWYADRLFRGKGWHHVPLPRTDCTFEGALREAFPPAAALPLGALRGAHFATRVFAISCGQVLLVFIPEFDQDDAGYVTTHVLPLFVSEAATQPATRPDWLDQCDAPRACTAFDDLLWRHCPIAGGSA